jgi:hypothetical protein
MIAESVTVDPLTEIVGRDIGPIKAFSKLDVKLITYASSTHSGLFKFSEFFVEQIESYAVELDEIGVVGQIPQAKNHENTLLTCFVGKIQAGINVGKSGVGIAFFKAM